MTAEKFTTRHFQQNISVLALTPRDPGVEVDVRVKINCRGNGGSAALPEDHWVVIDSIFPLRKESLIVTSATPITDVEEREVRQRLRDWLGL
ncbi:hypothetical protein [Neolewinella lacunae]|uniref:hypothetical protein n=1 Tax=Neolewinella lacunae TaxID=1517758 RepID=UPI001CA44118|nr:hypothetical protein [Neolewinella lacunae]